MRTVADPAVLRALIARLRALQPDSRRGWGTLTAHEMLCHLGDASEMVLRIRPRVNAVPRRTRPVFKIVVLWSPIRWPHDQPTNPMHDPKAGGTKPTAFDQDRERVISGLRGIAAAKP
jgi:hypothetical protein